MQRRGVLAGAALVCVGSSRALADVDPDVATQFIEGTGRELIRLLTGTNTPEERRRRLGPFILQVVDVDAVARFCLGRGWQAATADQQATYLRLFRLILVNNVAAHLGSYAPGQVSIATGHAAQRPEGQFVPTTIDRPNNKPVTIGWLVSDVGGVPRIIDVTAEGVSLRVTQRSDYTAFMNRNNGQVGALLEALQRQVETLHLA